MSGAPIINPIRTNNNIALPQFPFKLDLALARSSELVVTKVFHLFLNTGFDNILLGL